MNWCAFAMVIVLALEEVNADDRPRYVVLPGPMTWDEARLKCEDMYAHLAEIHTAEDTAEISSLIIIPDPLWIGVHDQISEGTFQYVNGGSLTYSNWNTGEPNDGGNEDCVHLVAEVDMPWNDAGCTNTHLGCVCEYYDTLPSCSLTGSGSGNTVVDGDSVSLRCTASQGVPPGVLVWLRDGDVGYTGTDVETTIQWTTAIAREDDGKSYQCNIQLRDGNNISCPNTIQFDVQYLPSIVGDAKYYVTVGESISMVLTVDANPLPVTFGDWKNDHLTLDTKEDTSVYSVVVIDTISDQHFGIYNITTINDIGTVLLQVILSPESNDCDSQSVPCNVAIVAGILISLLVCSIIVNVIGFIYNRRLKNNILKKQMPDNDQGYTTISQLTREKEQVYELPMVPSKATEDEAGYETTSETEPTYETPTNATVYVNN